MTSSLTTLLKRETCWNTWGGVECQSDWYWWGRWVVLGVAILFVLLAFLAFLIARRRRTRGMRPFYGTGWMAPTSHGPSKYPPQQTGYSMPQYNAAPPVPNPPPTYGQAQTQPMYTGTTFNTNDGYYGSGVQHPGNTYQPDNNMYSPPAGPPPGSKN